MDGSGYEDLAARSGRLRFDMSKLLAAGPSGIDPAKGTMEMIFISPAMYMRSPLFDGELPAGKAWMKIDLRRAMKGAGINVTMVSRDPTEVLGYLRAESGKVTRVGRESVRGVDTTHYRATADLTKAPGLDRRSADRIVQLGGARKVPIEAWIDRRNMVRRMRIVMTTKAPAGSPAAGEKMTIDQTIELFAFGPKPRVTPPPAREVFDASDIAARAAASGLRQH